MVRRIAREKLAEFLDTGRDPLQVLLDIAFSEELDVGLRIQAAGIALPFMRPRLPQMVVNSTSVTTKVDGAELLRTLQERIARLAPPTPPAQTIIEAHAEPAGGAE